MLAILQWLDSKKSPEVKTPREKKVPPVNPLQILEEKRRELQQWEAWVKDMEKINKKEEKKPKTWMEEINTPQLAIMLVLFVPIYMSLISKFLH